MCLFEGAFYWQHPYSRFVGAASTFDTSLLLALSLLLQALSQFPPKRFQWLPRVPQRLVSRSRR
jgi:hypothetical protein